MIALKDMKKLTTVSVIACCAVFVCSLFMNYQWDLASVEDQIVNEAGRMMFEAQIASGKVTIGVTGGCLVITSLIMLVFYIKSYIDTHGKELGILKALGYRNIQIAKHFWIFACSVCAGCGLGYAAAYFYMPTFYEIQNVEQLLPKLSVNFYPLSALYLILVPTLLFALIAIAYATLKLKHPVLDLLKNRRTGKSYRSRKENSACSFLHDLRKSTLRTKKTLVFFVAFSAFCFASMVQMSISMMDLASEEMGMMILNIGLILAFVTLLLSLSTVVKGNMKTIAMMRSFGYSDASCTKAILGGYRIFTIIGFAIGTLYQYALLKFMVSVVFANMENIPFFCSASVFYHNDHFYRCL